MLGIGILAGACITKLPQILSVWNARSAAGLSVFAVELENWCYLIHTSYGYIMVRLCVLRIPWDKGLFP